MTAAAKGSVGSPMLITKDEATAAQRTFLFHLCKTADQADDTGVVPVVTISKAGAAFAGAVGPVTEIANGWYKIVLDAADVDTIGQLAMRIAVATADTLDVVHQVIVLDLNTATVNPGAGGITTASFAAGAINAAALAPDAIGASELAAGGVTKIQTGLATAAAVAALATATRTVVVDLGLLEEDGHTNADGAYCGISILDALDATITLTGTWDSSTVTAETCEDPAATVPVWVAYAGPRTTDGTIVIDDAPHSAVRLVMSNDGAASSVAVSVSIRKPVGA